MEGKLSGTGKTDTVELYYDEATQVFAMPSLSVAVVLSSATKSFKVGKKYMPPTKPADAPKEDNGSEIEPYDIDNLHPQRLKKMVESNNMLQNGLVKSAKELLGHGIETGVFVRDEKTNEDGFKFQRQQAWVDFAKTANLYENFEGLASRSLVTHYISFVSLIFDETGTAIKTLIARSPLDCRLSKMNADGFSEFCYFSRQWHNGPSITDVERVKKIPIIDTWYMDVDFIREQITASSEREWMMVLRIPTDDFPYPFPDWLAVIRQKYLDNSNNVPIWKDAVMKHQTTLNQIMYLSEDYFKLKYPLWEMNSEKAKSGDKEAIIYIRERREKVIKDIHDQISGKENAGKMIIGHLIPNLNNINDKELRKSILFEAIPQVKMDGSWIPDANEADKQILFAIEVDGNKYGGLPGATDSGGSNKREASNNSQLNKYTLEEILLKPYRFIRDYNSMGDFEFMVKRAMTPTLDQLTAKDRQLNQPK